jgi:flagella basal body P-ring formation protein FlgA
MSFLRSLVERLTRTSRTLVGLVLIVASIVGVTLVVRSAAPGNRIVMAAAFLPAGTIITAESLREGRISPTPAGSVLVAEDVIGRVAGVDIGDGEFISARMLEAIPESRVRVSVPLGITPPTTIARGSVIELWAVDADEISPPVAVARNATVLAVVESGLGGGTALTLLVTAFDVDRVLSAIGSSDMMVATEGETP